MQTKKYTFRLLFAICFTTILCKLFLNNSMLCDASIGNNDPDKFIAYCHNRFHGHYDHAAYLYDLEAGLTESIQQANVLFFGSSRIQYALSTPQLTEINTKNPGIRPYLLGFGHIEQDLFATAILERTKPKPLVVVINADPFFQNKLSNHAKLLLTEPQHQKINATLKKYWHNFNQYVCNHDASFVRQYGCGPTFTLLRSIKNGQWFMPSNEQIGAPVTEIQANPIDREPLNFYVSNAEQFLNKLPTKKKCIVITSVPGENQKPFIAKDIAKALGLTFIAPKIDGLVTFDGDHLAKHSRERWSKEFLNQLEPIIHACLNDA